MMKNEEEAPLIINQNGVATVKVESFPVIVEEEVVNVKEESKYKKKKRLLSLDVLRGMTVFMMIVVNNQPGEGGTQYWMLDHAEFNGLTPTDFIFPFFLWIMGYAMGIVFSRKIRNPEEITTQKILWNPRWTYKIKKGKHEMIMKWVRIVRRSVLLCLLGFGGSLLGHLFDFRVVRFPGVLQRIGICYFLMSVLMNVFPNIITQFIVVFNLHLLYCFLMFCIPYPNCGPGQITKYCSAESFFDLGFFGQKHIYQTTYYYDPEGLVSTLTSLSTTFLGVLFFRVARYVKNKHDNNTYVLMALWLIFGVFLIIIGMILNEFLWPYNKHIWSSAFVFVTAGTAGIFLAIVTWVVDVLKIKFWMWIFLYCGVNPLFMYVVPSYTEVVLYTIPTGSMSLYDLIFKYVFRSWIRPVELANALFGIVFECCFIPFAVIFYYAGIFIKL